MKTVKVSEVIEDINTLIRNKKQNQKQLQSLYHEIHKIINLDEVLQGEHGETIKEHFNNLHRNALAFLDIFFGEYIRSLEDVKNNIEAFETEKGLIRMSFLKGDVMEKLIELDEFTNEMVADINKQYNEVSDLVAEGRVSTYYFNLNLAHAGSLIEKTATELEALDAKNTSTLTSAEVTLDEISNFAAEIMSWTKDDDSLSAAILKEIENFYTDSNMLQKFDDHALPVIFHRTPLY